MLSCASQVSCKTNRLLHSHAGHVYRCHKLVTARSERPERFLVLCKHVSPGGLGCQSLEKIMQGSVLELHHPALGFPSFSGCVQLCPSRNVDELPPELCTRPPMLMVLAQGFKNSCNNNTGALVAHSLPRAEAVQGAHSQARDHGLKASLLPSVLPGSRDEDAPRSLGITPGPRGTTACLARVTQGRSLLWWELRGFTPRG